VRKKTVKLEQQLEVAVAAAAASERKAAAAREDCLQLTARLQVGSITLASDTNFLCFIQVQSLKHARVWQY
jgi:hypothetical protein